MKYNANYPEFGGAALHKLAEKFSL